MTMNARICHNLGHLDILHRRRDYAKGSFEKLYGTIFREQSKLDYCIKRMDCASHNYATSILGCVPGLKLKVAPAVQFQVNLDCASFKQPFNGHWGSGGQNPGE